MPYVDSLPVAPNAVRRYSEGGSVPVRAYCDECFQARTNQLAADPDRDWMELSASISFFDVTDAPAGTRCEACDFAEVLLLGAGEEAA